MERYNKQDIQKNIQNRRKHQEIKWSFAVTKCTEHVRDHIVKNSSARSEKDHEHIIISFSGDVIRDLHPSENLVSQQIRVSTKSLADDHRVSECIKKLEQISENDRNSKF